MWFYMHFEDINILAIFLYAYIYKQACYIFFQMDIHSYYKKHAVGLLSENCKLT